MSCKIKNCFGKGLLHRSGRRYTVLGYCESHYRKLKKYGDPLYEVYRRGEKRKKNPLYSGYKSMISRCTNKLRTDWKYYGGRGISVCERWLGPNGFRNFEDDMGPRPLGKTLDRIDSDGSYCPTNCHWATRMQQSRNQRRYIANNPEYNLLTDI